MKRVRIEAGFFKPQPRVRLVKRVRLEKRKEDDPRWQNMKDRQDEVGKAIQEVATLFPRTNLRSSSAAIVYGEVTGYSSATAAPRYKPGTPEEVVLDMLWMVAHNPHMYWTAVMMAGVDAIRSLIEGDKDA